jgi:hypothetical protein
MRQKVTEEAEAGELTAVELKNKQTFQAGTVGRLLVQHFFFFFRTKPPFNNISKNERPV